MGYKNARNCVVVLYFEWLLVEMKRHSWLEWDHIKESVSLFFLNFHYIVLLSILQIVLTFLVLPAGPSWIAMCKCLRSVAEGQKLHLGDYFRGVWRYRVRGLLYSLIFVSCIIGLVFGFFLLNVQAHSELGISSMICAGILFGLTMYMPFALAGENKVLTTVFISVKYFLGRFSSSVVVLSIISIFFLIFYWLSPVLVALIIPGLAAFTLSRIIVANNHDVDDEMETVAE